MLGTACATSRPSPRSRRSATAARLGPHHVPRAARVALEDLVLARPKLRGPDSEEILARLHARAQPVVTRLHRRDLVLHRDLLSQQTELLLLQTYLLLELQLLLTHLVADSGHVAAEPEPAVGVSVPVRATVVVAARDPIRDMGGRPARRRQARPALPRSSFARALVLCRILGNRPCATVYIYWRLMSPMASPLLLRLTRLL